MTAPVLPPLILLVEDFDDAREMYREYLTFSGFRVATATNGQQAVDAARTLNPDLILMDLSLPGIDGWEATRILKSDPATAHLVIVALSAHALASDGEGARRAGCDGFIPKPCLPPDLVTRIAGFLKTGHASSEAKGKTHRRL
jgi:CheY-like chemotaxis protein